MKNTEQTNLSEGNQKPANPTPKRYSVQKYRLSYVKERDVVRITIAHRNDVADFCRQYLSTLPLEKVCTIGLDNSNRIIGYDVTEGTTNQAAIYPAKCFSFLFSCAASSFILAHDHPGGNCNASEADWLITERLKKAGELLEIPLLDHLIITETACISLREHSRWNRN